MRNNLSQGYAALISILIICFVLLSIVTATSFESFEILLNVWSRHSKIMSSELAESCVDQAVIRVLQNPNFRVLENGESIKIDEDFFCRIVSIHKQDPLFVIQTEASVNKIFTKIESVFDPENFKIISLKELSS